MDLSKDYDCLPHGLIVAKLEAYGLDKDSIRSLFDCLSCRKQRNKMVSTYSNWPEFFCGIPQRSILGPLRFNTFMNKIFFFIEKSKKCNFTDGNTLYSSDRNLKKILYLIWRIFYFGLGQIH